MGSEIEYSYDLAPEVDSYEDSSEESLENSIEFSDESLDDSIEDLKPIRKSCYATELYENIPSMDFWCAMNCIWRPSFCPETHCFCDYYA